MKKFRVESGPQEVKTLAEALELAEKTGVLTVPYDAAFLCVNGGMIHQEVNADE